MRPSVGQPGAGFTVNTGAGHAMRSESSTPHQRVDYAVRQSKLFICKLSLSGNFWRLECVCFMTCKQKNYVPACPEARGRESIWTAESLSRSLSWQRELHVEIWAARESG
ncbi:hypothetical protein RB213_015271 [Colletotrichum asianum]